MGESVGGHTTHGAEAPLLCEITGEAAGIKVAMTRHVTEAATVAGIAVTIAMIATLEVAMVVADTIALAIEKRRQNSLRSTLPKAKFAPILGSPNWSRELTCHKVRGSA